MLPGASARYFGSNAMIQRDDIAVGIDFGGTKVLGAVVDRRGRVLARQRTPTPKQPQPLIDSIVGLVKSLEAEVGRPIEGVGIGAAGLVGRDGVLHFGTNVGGIEHLDLVSGVGNQLPAGYKVRVDNDANVATWGECLFGAGRRAREMAMVTIGTGVGGGLVSSGRLFRGEYGFGAEFGHITIVHDGAECGCGRRGCWEAYASGTALGRLGREAAEAGRFRAGMKMAGSVSAIHGEHVSQAAHEGDIQALEIFRSFARWLGVGITSVVSLLDPEVIVIGGGLSEEAKLFIDETRRYVDENNFGAAQRPKVEIKVAELEDDAGIIGAAMLVFGEMIPEL